MRCLQKLNVVHTVQDRIIGYKPYGKPSELKRETVLDINSYFPSPLTNKERRFIE